jgi:hypothetical protein
VPGFRTLICAVLAASLLGWSACIEEQPNAPIHDPGAVSGRDDGGTDANGGDPSGGSGDDPRGNGGSSGGSHGGAGDGNNGGVGDNGGTGGSSGGSHGGAGDGGDGGTGGAGSVGDNGGGHGERPDDGGSQGTSPLPPTEDYGAPGPFSDADMIQGVGPNKNYTLFRPMASLGRDGFKHPIAVWGNGILTTPDQYKSTLTLVATHGFVIAACNDTQAERPCLNAGLDWLVEQNSAPGELQGKLDTGKEFTIGYSWGGGAAIDTANRPNVKATVSLYGMPPRGATAFEDMHAPLLLFTSTGDSFVSAQGYVTPNYNKSQVQTFYATRNGPEGHLYIIDEGAISCIASGLLSGPCGSAKAERGPMIAWLRLWAYGDKGARKYFYGDDCMLCKSPWSAQRKHWVD